MIDVIIIGGGAAGVFAAIAAKAAHPEKRVVLLEKTMVLLAKVRISGGGRCNVTHACFDPKLLVNHYPRGEKELLGPFYLFQPQDTVEWFISRGVELKTEADGRIFPVSNSSETIVQALLLEAKTVGVEFFFKQRISHIYKTETGFSIELKEGGSWECRKLILATGSSPEGHYFAELLGHTIQRPVPSLFTFNIPTSPLKELSGVAMDSVEVHLEGSSLVQKGPLLITHFGFSGPAVLKLSAWGARFLYEKNYRAVLRINWLPSFSEEKLYQELLRVKKKNPQKNLAGENPFHLPRKLWKVLIGTLDRTLGHIAIKDLQSLADKLHADKYQIEGKTTHKEEFVTCGGVTLKEVNFKTMESKICPGLFFAGEILDVDGITGGFNFQNAWTTGFIAGYNLLLEY